MVKNPENTAEEPMVLSQAEKGDYNGTMSVSEKLNLFIQNNRRIIVLAGASLLVLFIGFVAGLVIADALRTGALTQVEEFNRRYESLNLTDAAKEGEVTAFIDELTAFASKHSGYASARGYSLLGNLYMEKKDWSAAQKAWTSAAQAGGKTYMVPVSLCNAGAAAEEQGDIQGAVDFYTQSIAFGETFPTASRAQFQIGRLEETRNNKDAALQAYREVINKWPDDQLWTNLAQSRIITLTR